MKKKINGAVVVADRKDRAGRRDEKKLRVSGFQFPVSGWLNNAKHGTGNAKLLTLQKPKFAPKLSVLSSPRNQGMV